MDTAVVCAQTVSHGHCCMHMGCHVGTAVCTLCHMGTAVVCAQTLSHGHCCLHTLSYGHCCCLCTDSVTWALLFAHRLSHGHCCYLHTDCVTWALLLFAHRLCHSRTAVFFLTQTVTLIFVLFPCTDSTVVCAQNVTLTLLFIAHRLCHNGIAVVSAH